MEKKALPDRLKADLAEALDFFIGGADFGLDSESRELLTAAAQLYARVHPRSTYRLSLPGLLERSGLSAETFAAEWELDPGEVRHWFSKGSRCPRWVLLILQVLSERVADAQEDADGAEDAIF